VTAEAVAAVLESLRDRLAARLAAPRPAVAAGLTEEALRRAEVALLLERVALGRATAEELETDLLEALLLLRAARRGSEREPDADAQPVQSRRRSPTPPAPPPPAPPRSPDALALTGPQLRRLRWRVEHREGRFALIPAGLSWESIVAAGSPWLPLVSGRDAGRSDGTLRDASTGRGTGR
jgi:hypothetical protein